MEILNVVDINLFASAMVLLVLGAILKEKILSKDLFYFKVVILTTLLVLIISTISWIIDGKNVGFNYIISWMLIFFNGIPLTAWFFYLDYKARKESGIKLRKIIFMFPMVSLMILAIFQLYSGNVFKIVNYTYVRGPLVYLAALSMFLSFFVFLVYINRYRKHLMGRMANVVIIFSIIPIIMGFIQVMLYGINLLWPSMSLVVLYSFLYVEYGEILKDSLTGFLSRDQLEQHLKYKLRLGKPFSIIMIDMDKFKEVNDTYGHDEGDKALRTFAAIIKHEVKTIDSICRYGGDEFIILLETEEDVSNKIVNRIRLSVNSYNDKDIKPYKLRFSEGHLYIKTRKSLTQILSEVDEEMYRDKKRRKS